MIYSDEATSLAYINVFTVKINILKMLRKYPEQYSSASDFSSILIMPSWQDYLDFDLKKLDDEIKHIDEGKMQMASPNEMIGIIITPTASKCVSDKAMKWSIAHEIGHLISRDSIRSAQLNVKKGDDEYCEQEYLADEFATLVTNGEYTLRYEDLFSDLYKQYLIDRLKMLNPNRTKTEIKDMMRVYDNEPFARQRVIFQNSFAKEVREYRKQEKQ